MQLLLKACLLYTSGRDLNNTQDACCHRSPNFRYQHRGILPDVYKRQAQERAHILEGLIIACDNIDEVVHIIRASKTPSDAQRKDVYKRQPYS